MGVVVQEGRERSHGSRDAGREIEALRREVERLRVLSKSDRGLLDAILNHSPHGILVCDAEGKMLLQNRAAERIWRGSATAESVAGWGAYRAFHPDGRPYAPGDWAMARCLTHGETIDAHEIDVLRFDDSRGVLLGSCAPIFDESGRIGGAVAVFADVTPFRQLEGALKIAHTESDLLFRLTDSVARSRNVEEAYAHALDAITVGLRTDRASILLFDAAGAMRFRAWRGLSEAYRRAVDGHSPWTADAQAPQPILISDVEADETWRSYLPVFRAEGIRALGFFPLVHGERLIGKFMVYSAEPRVFSERDVRLALTVGAQVAQGVARQLAHEEIERLLDQASQARTLAERAVQARDHMLAVVSHDLRNQVNTLSLSAAAITRVASTAGNGPVGEATHRIQRALGKMNRMISDLLDVAAIDAGALQIRPAPVDVTTLLADALEQVRPLADERRQTIAVDCAPGLGVRADADRIVQVLANVVGNAVKFTPVDGTIHLSVRLAGEDGTVSFQVADSGSGIAADHLPHVFDRFWRAQQKFRGVGLGLAIARGIVEAHGGRIAAESPPGSGAIVRFTLPACLLELEAGTPVAAPDLQSMAKQ